MTRLARSTFWAYGVQLSGLSLNALLLPLLVWRFSLEQLAIWYLIQALGQLVSIAEGALEPALTRYLTYARSGVGRLPDYGELPGAGSGQSDLKLVQEVAGAAFWLYGLLSLGNLAVFGTAGALLLAQLGAPLGDDAQVLTAWILFSLGQCLGCRWFAAIPLLQGCGNADAAFRVLAIQRMAFGATAGIGLLFFGRLEVVGVAQFAAACIALWPALRAARQQLPWPAHAPSRPLRNTLLRGSAELWLSRIGGYLVGRANLPIMSAALDLGLVGRFALTMQFIDAFLQLAIAPAFACLPKLYELRSRLDGSAQSLAIVARVLLLGWLTFLGGGVVLLLWGDHLLALLGKSGALLPLAPLAVMLLAGVLEMNCSLSGTLLMVGNRVPFVRASLVSGVVSGALTTAALCVAQAGVWAPILVPLAVQASYNYWKWPLECLRLFQTSYRALLRTATLPP